MMLFSGVLQRMLGLTGCLGRDAFFDAPFFSGVLQRMLNLAGCLRGDAFFDAPFFSGVPWRMLDLTGCLRGDAFFGSASENVEFGWLSGKRSLFLALYFF
ncbi:hypothetical protein [Dapis sp. BLCC M229]|uniref:hypothetical protein n=1 Tax=Dapis sp. BLCC M229 TaxID=3400188 RepID=UPI003CF4016E